LALGGGKVPLGGLDLFRLVALRAAPGENPTDFDLFMCCVLNNDAILGSGDAMP